MNNFLLEVEVAVIGSGPGGALTAALLAESGHQVALIERGPELQLDSCKPFSLDEMRQKYLNGGVTVAMGRSPVSYVEGACVGGGSEVNSGLYHRTPEGLVEEWVRKFQIRDLDYSDLLPHFEMNECDLTVSYMPPFQIPKASFKLHAGATSLGWNSLEVPRWYSYDRDGSGTKQSMMETMIPRARAAGAVVFANADITKISRDESYQSRWNLHGTRNGSQDFVVIAKTVFVCCGAISTASLLRRSGLSQKAGRNFHLHPSVKLVAKFPDAVNDLNMGVPVHQVKEFSPRYSFGCSISSPSYLSLAMMDVQGGQHLVDACWKNMAIYYAMTTGGAGSISRVPFFKDPLVRYRFSSKDVKDILDAMEDLAKCLFAAGATEIFPAVKNSRGVKSVAEMRSFRYELTPDRLNLMSIHLFSSCPMGEDRELCVTDSYGALHGHQGIYLNDSSIIPTALGVNPQGTVMALARRNVKHYLETR